MTTRPVFLSYVIATVALLASPAQAQRVNTERAPSREGWRLTPSVATSGEYDNNVFLLRDGRRDNLGRDNVLDGSSGRYADMVSASDMVTSFLGTLDIEGRGYRGKKLSFTPELAYDLHARNAARSSGQMGVRVAQKLARGGLVRARLSVAPRAFVKNYLADAVDRDGDGSIARDERLYAPAEQGDMKISADYTHRLDKSTRKQPFGAALRLGGGWYRRSHNEAFTSRDLSGPTLDLALLVDLTTATRVRIGYDLEALSAPRMANVVLLDEARFDEDLNDNGSSDDIAARTVQTVDRSRTEHELGVALETDLSRAVDARLSLSHRRRTFGSTERYDVANNGRRDARNEVGGEVRFRLAAPLRLRVAGAYSSQSLNRAASTAVSGDVADYTRLRAAVGLMYRY